MGKINEFTKITEMQPSLIRKIFEAAQGMDDIINFSLGEPDFSTPENIVDVAVESMRRGETHYTANAGIFELRDAVSKHLKEFDHVEYDPTTEIMITSSGMEALYLISLALFNPGDEIIVSDPTYTNYWQMIQNREAVPVYVPVKEEDGFNFNIDTLRAVITDRTKAIWLNTPANPTGAVASKEHLEEIAALAIEKDIWVIFDEVYKYFSYDDLEFYSIAAVPGMKERTLVVDSFSKTYAMTGWRVGYIAGPSSFIKNLAKINDTIVCCVPEFVQKAAIEALENGRGSVEKMKQEYEKRRAVVCEGINAIDGLSCVKPGGAFYVFVNISKSGMTSEEFALRLLHEAKVAVSPGSAFGAAGEGFVRLSYGTSIDNIKEGLRRIDTFMKKLLASR